MSRMPAWELYPQDLPKRSDSQIRQADVRLRLPPTEGAASASHSMESSADLLCRLMERYANGEDTAFEQLYRALAPRLHRFCLRLAIRKADAEDCFQETFLKIHRARATYA